MNEGISQFRRPNKVNTAPLLKDLYQHVTPHYAADWEVIGTLLGLPSGELKAIEAGYPTNVKWCCNQMLKLWLEMDTTASWGKLFTIIESPAMSCRAPDKGNEPVTLLSEMVREVNIQTWSRVDEDTWPPEPPKTFIPLVLIQHQGHRNLEESTAMAELVARGHIDKVVPVTTTDTLPQCPNIERQGLALQEVLDTSKVTKEVAEILTPLEESNDPQFVSIEGIGKSLSLKEIAYRWDTKQILHKFILALLISLRDPFVQQMSFIDDLFQSFCMRDKEATEIASVCKKYFVKNNGEDLVLLLDGYDEYPKRLQEDSLIADILKRKVLPRCGLIVTSRPHASVSLRQQATVRVGILGFTKAEQERYIKETLKGQPQKIDELTQYLQSHSTISTLCFVPFNIVVLVYLYKHGTALPNNSAGLFNDVICLTVCRHFAKLGQHLHSNITKLTDLPGSYYKIIQQLSELSLEGLNDDKLIFTFDEIKAVCPDITEAFTGFGLLQVAEHFGRTGTIKTFNFLHFSIQEYLAAYHIASLPADKELRIIEDKFWSHIHFNMFSIYVSLTKGQQPSFKHFLCNGNKSIVISEKFLNNQLQCIRLYRCFHEAGDVMICKAIQQSAMFRNKKINLSLTTLTASDVECVTVFLTSSVHKEWMWLNLSRCYIQDHGLHILHHGLQHCRDIRINKLVLEYNGLTTQSSSLISDITMKCKVKVLWIAGNDHIGENEQLYSILSHPSTTLEGLYMWHTELSNKAAIALFTILKDNKKLKWLDIANNAITDDACDAITTALEKNSCLVRLDMDDNPMTSEGIINIVNSLKVNNTLTVLWLSQCSEAVKKAISSLQDIINKNRESRGCQVKLIIEH